jgi:Stage II sporulation protein E (SpoIIE)
MSNFFSIRNYVRSLVYGYAIGILIVFVTNLGEPVDIGRLAVFVVIIGFCINSSIWGLEILFRPLAERLPAGGQLPMHVTISMAGGAIGYLLGRVIGALLLDGRLPRSWSIGQPLLIVAAVSFFAGAAMFIYMQVENRLGEKVREAELAQQELTLARAIQERLLPPPVLEMDGFRITARNLPAQMVAGDFYDLITRADGRVVAVVADVAGKGVAASLVMVSVKSVLPMIASVENVETTMRRLNEKLARELSRREFVALTCVSYEPATGRVTMVNAGLPDPYLIRDGVVTPLTVTGPRLPLGVREQIEYESLSVELRAGDRLLMITDGLPEAATGEHEQLGYDRFAQLAGTNASLDALFAAVEAQTIGPRADDWTAVLLERL